MVLPRPGTVGVLRIEPWAGRNNCPQGQFRDSTPVKVSQIFVGENPVHKFTSAVFLPAEEFPKHAEPDDQPSPSHRIVRSYPTEQVTFLWAWRRRTGCNHSISSPSALDFLRGPWEGWPSPNPPFDKRLEERESHEGASDRPCAGIRVRSCLRDLAGSASGVRRQDQQDGGRRRDGQHVVGDRRASLHPYHNVAGLW